MIISIRRKRVLAFSLARTAVLLSVLANSFAPSRASGHYEENQVVVGLKPATSIATINARYQTTVLDHAPGTQDYLLQTQPGTNLDALVILMQSDLDLTYAEENDISETAESIQMTAPVVDKTANVQMYSNQPATASILLPQAQSLGSFGSDVIVAVIDTGIQFDRPELMQHVSFDGYNFVDNNTNTAELRNGIDDDLDSLIDEGFGHGTHVAGLVHLAAPMAIILPVLVLDDEGRGNAYKVAEGIRYAKNHGARVINMSFSLPRHSDLISTAIGEAQAAGITLVAAAGNDSQNSVSYPAREHGVIATAATDNAGVKTPFSNSGSDVVVCAPGFDLLSGFDALDWAHWTGTSMASPLVAGAAAVLLDRYPALSGDEVLQEIETTATNISMQNPGMNGWLGSGLVNLANLATITVASPDSLKVSKLSGSQATIVKWSTYQGASNYDLIRGNVASLQPAGITLSMGAVTCILNDTNSLSNATSPDTALPLPGKAFFYLMRPKVVNGSPVSYGQSTAGLDRIAASGDCPL